MKHFSLHTWLLVFVISVLSGMFSRVAVSQQLPDTAFVYTIQTPAYEPALGPLIAIDAAHHNFHTLEGGFAPLGKLLSADGYRVQPIVLPLTALKSATGPRILVIANALDDSDTSAWALPNPSAFSRDEIQNVLQWVADGGRLLLIADHMPFAGAAEDMAAAFGFRFLNGFAFTGERSWPPSKFSKKEGTLLSTPVTDGDEVQYIISEVSTFTGSAFAIPDQAIPVLKFNPEHWSLQPDTAWVFHPETPRVQLENYFQGAILRYGKGKIAVFGEAAMFTAQLVNGQMPVGFNSPESPQNAQFILNLVHWLDR